jgi:4-diphosphocytidyl-2-C-methyl-D-erythritol kinase
MRWVNRNMSSSSKQITVRGAAKINLFLDVLGRREDGYHEIETLLQPVGLWDELSIKIIESGIELTGDDPTIRWDRENLCYRAAEEILGRTGRGSGVGITVGKGIPHGAGLGGGSSDAAAVLLGLNELLGLGLERDELIEIGLSLGSDIPFFITGEPAVCRGRGEILERAEGLEKGWILIVKPNISISTSWAYQNLKIGLTRCGGKATLRQLIEGLKRFPEVELKAWNSFTGLVTKSFPEIGAILKTLRQSGAILSAMSGSGSACFALFGEQDRAAEVHRLFTGRGLFTEVVRPVDRAVILLHEE